MKTDVLIITLNYNQNDYTINCVESILQSTYENYTIMLIDNGSTDENYIELKNKLPKNEKVHLLRIKQNRGYVGGINYGLEEGAELKPDYFLIMNNDTIIDKVAISELVKTCMDYYNQAIVSGKVYYYDEPRKLQDIGYTFKNKKQLTFKSIGLNEEDKGQYNKEAERDMLDDVFWLIPGNLYVKIGGYSHYFWFNAEQADFAMRAKKVGYKLIYTPNAKLRHKGSVSIGGRERNPILVYWHIQSTLIFKYIHLSLTQFLKYYIKVQISVLATYLSTIYESSRGKATSFKYANAKLYGLNYFHSWLFKRNENTGANPFQ